MTIYNFNNDKPKDTGITETGSTGSVQTPESINDGQTTTQVPVVKGNDGENKVVVMQGPLSQIYTEALNAVYAQESQANDAVLMIEDAVKQNIDESSKDLYVYAMDDETLEKSDLNTEFERLRIALDNKKIHKKVVVLESHGAVSRRLSLLDAFARENGVMVCYSRKTALESIVQCLKG